MGFPRFELPQITRSVLDLPCKTDLDLRDSFGRKKILLITDEYGSLPVQREVCLCKDRKSITLILM